MNTIPTGSGSGSATLVFVFLLPSPIEFAVSIMKKLKGTVKMFLNSQLLLTTAF
jgi:hypothetical protein